MKWFSLGFNYRLPDFACALGMQQLNKLDANLARRREIAARYTAAFREIRGLIPPAVRPETNPAWHLYPIRLDLKNLTADRAEIFRALRAENIGVNVHYIPVHFHPYYRDHFGYKGGEFPVAEDAYSRLHQPADVSRHDRPGCGRCNRCSTESDGSVHPMSVVKLKRDDSQAADTSQAAVWKGILGASIRTEIPWTPSVSMTFIARITVLRVRKSMQDFLADIPKEASFLEVGCNTGNQLLMLNRMGWSNLSAVELQPYAAEIASQRLSESLVKLGSALAVPFADSAFDVVFTSGVLIHIAPKDLPRALDEIHRTSRRIHLGPRILRARSHGSDVSLAPFTLVEDGFWATLS